jgi:hypothetical protein
MNNPDVLQVCAEARIRLESIAKSQGIPLNIVQVPLLTPELRDLCLALAIAPDDAAAERATKRYAPAVAGFLFATRNIGVAYCDEIHKVDESVDIRLCPYFYLSQFVSSIFDSLEKVSKEMREKGEA